MSNKLRVVDYGFMMMCDVRSVICDKNFFHPHPRSHIPFLLNAVFFRFSLRSLRTLRFGFALQIVNVLNI
jgi:hypothetical protein